MRILLAGALPPPSVAAALVSPLQTAAPTFAGWLTLSRTQSQTVDTAASLCTPWEAWLLQECGFEPRPGQAPSAGLGPLLGPESGHAGPVWLLELAHFSPSRDGAVLIPARQLAITQEQSVALFASARHSFEESGFEIRPCGTTHLTLQLPDGVRPACPSPELVSQANLNDWWPQDVALRPWRRLFNEVQMLWFDHPVNEMRTRQGQPPLNALWLFGGATRAQLQRPPAEVLRDTHIEYALADAVNAQDWGGWLEEMRRLERTLFAAQRGTRPEIIFTGADRILVSKPGRRWWHRLRRNTPDTWSTAWSNPA